MCSRLGGKVGNDANGDAYREAFGKEDINTTFLYTDPDEPSGVAHIMVETSSGNNIIIVVPGSNATLSEQEVEKADSMIQNAKLISFGLEGNHGSVIKAMELARKYGVKTMTNAAPARSDLDPRIFELTDILCVNESEAQIILGRGKPIETEENIEEAMKNLLKKCHTIIITLGEKGAAVATRENSTPSWVKAEKVDKVVDTTGAGDSFVGSMSYYLAYHPDLDMSEMIRRSCDIASISVQKEGTQTSFPYRKNLSSDKFF